VLENSTSVTPAAAAKDNPGSKSDSLVTEP
jgi:hypothetical protein